VIFTKNQSEAYDRVLHGSKFQYFVHLTPQRCTTEHEASPCIQTLHCEGTGLTTTGHAAAQAEVLFPIHTSTSLSA